MEAEEGCPVGVPEDVTVELNGIALGMTEGNGVGIGDGMDVGTILLSALGVTVRPDDGDRGGNGIVGKADGVLVGCTKCIGVGLSRIVDGIAVGIGVGIGVVAAVGLHVGMAHIVVGITVGSGVGIGVVAAVGVQLGVPHFLDGIGVGSGVGIGVVAVVGLLDGTTDDGEYEGCALGVFDKFKTGAVEGSSQEAEPVNGIVVGREDGTD